MIISSQTLLHNAKKALQNELMKDISRNKFFNLRNIFWASKTFLFFKRKWLYLNLLVCFLIRSFLLCKVEKVDRSLSKLMQIKKLFLFDRTSYNNAKQQKIFFINQTLIKQISKISLSSNPLPSPLPWETAHSFLLIIYEDIPVNRDLTDSIQFYFRVVS